MHSFNLGAMRPKAASLMMVLAATGLIVVACSSEQGFGDTGKDAGKDAAAADIAIVPDGGFANCSGLLCKVQACKDAQPTRIRGRVFDPGGTAPLYNAVVYVPSAAPRALPAGAVCDKCSDALVNPVGRAVLSNENGEFVIENAPSGSDIPIVFQIGKWRRQVTVNVTPCQDNVFDSPALMHLPTKQSEGDMPQIAVVTGGCDPLGCLFARMGIDASEFTDASGKGKIHVFKGFGGEGVAGGSAAPAETDLWNDSKKLKAYDMVLLSCECKEHDELKSEASKRAMLEYLDLGGRVFATHYHYTWLKNGPAPLASLADWGISPASSLGTTYNVEQGFPKGAAMAQWLVNTGASTKKGEIDIKVPVEHLRGVKAGAQRWIYRGKDKEEMVKFFSFNTPVGAPKEAQCGRGVLSDIHVADGDGTGASPDAKLPQSCEKGALSSRERALEFLMFDLASCVQPDDLAPLVPN
jgi:hypothetical protein